MGMLDGIDDVGQLGYDASTFNYDVADMPFMQTGPDGENLILTGNPGVDAYANWTAGDVKTLLDGLDTAWDLLNTDSSFFQSSGLSWGNLSADLGASDASRFVGSIKSTGDLTAESVKGLEDVKPPEDKDGFSLTGYLSKMLENPKTQQVLLASALGGLANLGKGRRDDRKLDIYERNARVNEDAMRLKERQDERAATSAENLQWFAKQGQQNGGGGILDPQASGVPFQRPTVYRPRIA